MSSPPDSFKSKFILLATLKAKPGKADLVQQKLAAIRAVAESDAAPKCLTYRTSRAGDDFSVFEEYADKAALDRHREFEEFKSFIAVADEILDGPPSIYFYEEFS